MNVSTEKLTDAKEITAGLLDELGLEAYLFEVEPRAGAWEVRVDCGYRGGWQSVTLAVDIDRLLDSRVNATSRAQVLNDWRERLAACRYPGPGNE